MTNVGFGMVWFWDGFETVNKKIQGCSVFVGVSSPSKQVAGKTKGD